jgi:hypothetical protein
MTPRVCLEENLIKFGALGTLLFLKKEKLLPSMACFTAKYVFTLS